VETIVELFLNSTEKYKDKISLQKFFEDEKKEIFYFEVRENVEKIIFWLKNQNLEKGTHIGIYSENRPEWVYAYFGILGIGGVVVGIDVNLKPQEVLFILQHAEIKIIFVSQNALPNLLKIKAQTNLEKIICFDDIEEKEVISLSELLKEKHFPFSYPEISPQDLAMLVYTSGTTGNPKAVMLSHKNITSNIKMILQVFQWDQRDNFLSLLPLAHIFELTCGFLTPFSQGARITYVDSLKPENILKIMQKTKVTFMMVVPGILRLFRLEILKEIRKLSLTKKAIFYICFFICAFFRIFNLNLGKILFRKIHRQFGKIKYLVSGGAPLSPFLIWWFDVLGINILQGYGLTETSPVVSVNLPLENRIGSVGKPLPGVKVKIKDNLEEGEILVKGENVMLGYYKNPQETERVLKDGWLYTGDIGKIDSHGFLYILGREKDVIVLQSGLKVYPEELEEELLKSPFIRDVCIIGKRKWGESEEKVHALIVVNEETLGLSLSSAREKIREIIGKEIKNLNSRISVYKRIDSFELREELPKTATKKIKKELIRKYEVNN